MGTKSMYGSLFHLSRSSTISIRKARKFIQKITVVTARKERMKV
jgi:hypothetical protein